MREYQRIQEGSPGHGAGLFETISPVKTPLLRFAAKIEVVGVNPCVRVPARITRVFGKRGYVPVVVHLQRGTVPSTLVPLGGGVHRLYINGVMLRQTDARPGDRLAIGLELDTGDRRLKTPDQLSSALVARPLAQARWKALTPSKRKEIIRYLESGKSSETRSRNATKLLRILESETGEGVLCGIRIADRRGRGRSSPPEKERRL